MAGACNGVWSSGRRMQQSMVQCQAHVTVNGPVSGACNGDWSSGRRM